jgi:hypothetical protein
MCTYELSTTKLYIIYRRLLFLMNVNVRVINIKFIYYYKTVIFDECERTSYQQQRLSFFYEFVPIDDCYF